MISLIVLQSTLLVFAVLFPEYSKYFHTSISALFLAYAGLRVFHYRLSSVLLFFAMAFCFLGDLILAKIIPVPESFLTGMASFAVGQILYILLFKKVLKEAEQRTRDRIFYRSMLVMGVVLLGVWSCLVIPADADLLLTIAILVYGGLLVTMASYAMQLIVLSNKYLLVGLGGVSFLISDMVIALTSVVGMDIPAKKHVIWFTYTFALMGMIYGLVWAKSKTATFSCEDDTASE